MKKFILLMLIGVFSVALQAQDGINWMSLEEAVAAQKKEPRKIMMDVYTNWCGPCKLLDKRTFANKDVAKYVNDNFYAVKFNAEGDKSLTYKDKEFTNPGYDPAKKNKRNSSHQFASYLQVRGYPSIVFFDENADLITPLTGFLTPQQLELYLKLFVDDKHKEIKSREAFQKYQSQFVAEFKG